MPAITIPFNKPYLTGKETHYIYDAVSSGKLSGNGKYTKDCQHFLEQRYGFGKCLLTTSCTDALEMAAILLRIAPGDEVIVPSYTFVSTANAFVLRGATIVFADSYADHPNMDPASAMALITERTKAIVLVHYAGIACDMGAYLGLCERYGIELVEDAAQAIDGRYEGKPLGSFGGLSAFSFHETKNIIAGEGGALTINDMAYAQRAEIIWEKGTNRAEFFRGEVNKYGWVDVGSSFLPSEATAAFLYAQLENLDAIQAKRIALYGRYSENLRNISAATRLFELPLVPAYSSNNAHMFYLVCATGSVRDALIAYLKERGVLAVFHYISLHSSPFVVEAGKPLAELPNADRFTACLVRLPLYMELTFAQVDEISGYVHDFFASQVATETSA